MYRFTHASRHFINPLNLDLCTGVAEGHLMSSRGYPSPLARHDRDADQACSIRSRSESSIHRFLLEALDHQVHHLVGKGAEVEPLVQMQHLLPYPENLTLQNLYYFMLVPTLCYELNFPRNPYRRKMFIVRRLFEFVRSVESWLLSVVYWLCFCGQSKRIYVFG